VGAAATGVGDELPPPQAGRSTRIPNAMSCRIFRTSAYFERYFEEGMVLRKPAAAAKA
jgi:hypothetical protein